MKRSIILWMLSVMTFAATAQTPQYQYWIDSTDDIRQGTLTNGEFRESIDFSGMSDGLHLFTFRANDGNGNWSVPQTSAILKLAEQNPVTVSNIEYWIDDISSRKNSSLQTDGVFSADIDFSTLSDGVHLFSYRVNDNLGNWSAPYTSAILKPSVSATSTTDVEYWIDDISKRKSTSLQADGVFSADIDFSTLADGLHLLSYRVKDNLSHWSAPQTSVILKGTNACNLNAYQYWFNNAETPKIVEFTNGTSPYELTAMLDFTADDVDKSKVYRWTDEDGKSEYRYLNLLTMRFRDDKGSWGAMHTDTIGVPIGNEAVNYTNIIVNPSATLSGNGWTYTGTHSVKSTNHYAGSGKPYFSLGSSNSAAWESSMSQTIEGLRAGTYLLTVKSRAAEGTEVRLCANDESLVLPTQTEGGDIWEDASEGSAEKSVNDGKGFGWNRSTLVFACDGSPVTIKLSAKGDKSGLWAEAVDFELWSTLTGSLTVSYSNGINPETYKDMRLVLSGKNIKVPLTTTSERSYMFRGIEGTDSLSVALINGYCQTIWSRENFTAQDCGFRVLIDDVLPLRTLKASVSTPEGQDVTDQTTLNWIDASGSRIGLGNRISGVADGYDISLDAVPSDSLGVIYECPQRLTFNVSADMENVNIGLVERTKVTVTGKVYGIESKPLPNANVSASQILSGRYSHTVTASTDAAGTFSMEVPIDSCRFTVSHTGYLNSTVSVADPTAVGDITLRQITGNVISLNLKMLQSVKPDQIADTIYWTGSTSNLEMRLTNATQSIDSVPYILQGNSLIVESGLTPGDRLVLAVHSRTGEFADGLCSFQVKEDGSAVADCIVSEFGAIDLKVTGSHNLETRALLFDNQGRFCGNEELSFNGRATFSSLRDGEYTVIVMGQSDLFGNVADIETVENSGLTANQDYLVADVSVSDGIISELPLGVVPEFKDSEFYYTSPDASFTVNKTSVVSGSYLTYTAKIDFKEEYASASDIRLTVDIPEEFRYVENSGIVGSRPAMLTEDNGKITFHLTQDNYRDRIRFCVMPFKGGETYTHATLTFDCGGEKVQPFGRLLVESEAMKIKVPNTINTDKMIVSGNCLPNSRVVVYDGNREMGSTYAQLDGSWRLQMDFNDPVNLSNHAISARISAEGFDEDFYTECRNVEYNKDANVVRSVTMINTVNREYVTKFDFINPTNKEKVYSFVPRNPTFTFIVDFTQNSPEYVENVFVKVHTSSGDTKTLKANYSASKGKWIATGDFNSFCMPRNVSVAYDKKKEERKYDYRSVDNDLPSLEEGVAIIREIENRLSSLRSELQVFFKKPTRTFEEFKKILVKYDCYYEVDEDYEFPSDVRSAIDKLVGTQTQEEAEAASDQLKKLIEEKTIHFRAAVDSYKEYYKLLQNGGTATLDDIEYKMSKNVTIPESILESEDYKSVSTVDGKTLYVKYGDGYNCVYDPNKMEQQSFTWTPEGVDFSNSTAAQMQEYLDKEYNAYIQELQGLQVPLKKQASWIEQEIEFLKYTGGILISEAEKGICNSWVEEALWDGAEFKMDLDFEKKFGISNASQTKYYEAGKKGYLAYLDYNTGKDFYNDYEDWHDKYAHCFGSLEGAFVWLEVKGFQTVESLARVEKFLGVYKLDRKLGAIIKEMSGGTVRSALSFLKDYVTAPVDRFLDTSIYGYHSIAKDLLNDQVQDCDPENPVEPDEEEESPDANGNDQQDPSGYVYEAVTSNRLPGVTASIYQKVIAYDMYGDPTETPEFWNAEKYMQVNPQTTDDMGKYGWDVPQGEWQVRFTKPGYEPVSTEWLPVPPPQLDVNVGMKHAVSPRVNGAKGYESGITVEFSKYMKPETFADTTMTVRHDGKFINGAIKMVDLESEPLEGKSFASKVKFVPERPFTAGDTVRLNVAHGCLSYADMPLTDDAVMDVVILPELRSITTDPENLMVFIGQDRKVTVTALPVAATAGKTLHIMNASSSLAEVNTQSLTLDANGQGAFTIHGELPGVAQLQLSVKGYDMIVEKPAQIVWMEEKVATPVASIPSNTEVSRGTPVALKCRTVGAHIYYTTDGSDPSDKNNSGRMLYTAPIIIGGNTLLKAVGMMEGVEQSDIAEFVYSAVSTGVEGVVSASADVHVENNEIVIRNCRDTHCDIFNAEGIRVWSRSRLNGEIRVPVAGAGVYIVRLVDSKGTVTANTLLVK